jgi:hypothetical protein
MRREELRLIRKPIAEQLAFNNDTGGAASMNAAPVEADIAYSVGKSRRSRSRCPNIVETL